MIQKKITFAAKDTDVLEWNGDLLAVGVTEKDVVKDDNNNFTNPLLQKLDALLGGLLAEASSEEDFSGKSGQAIVLRVSGLSFKRVGLFALGQSASRAAAFVGLGEAIAAAAQASRAVSVAFSLAFSADLSDEWKPAIASSIAIGTSSINVKLSTFSELQ
ncbi:leucine aminopeptidase 3, chloroplastic-like [Cucumis melo]|uniref:Leucine aminopeptidase 3, chloroplastic-like n=1 Tax=Cucumis melo TaxID=3656 RepID=A0ABM3KU10_CUCME|nr:leucine aminopeptidase 3, chloroplastic-like [Cucumis melo]